MPINKKRKTSEGDKDFAASAIVFTCIPFGDEDEMISSAINATKEVLEAEPMRVEYLNTSTFVTNEGGLHLAAELDRIEPLTSEVAQLRQELHTMQRSNRELTEEIRSLQAGNLTFLDIRSRFISTTKRDILRTATAADHSLIRAGNAAAHPGARLDTLLYQSEARNDVATYEFLYGVHPSGIPTILSKFLFSSSV